jgi:hypothetical protein
MRLQRTSFVSILLATLLAASMFAGSVEETKAQQDNAKAAVLFVVYSAQLPNAYIVPIATIEQGQFKPAIAGDSEADEITRFHDAYYSKGHKYRVLFGGGEAGSLTVTKSNRGEECARTSANVALQTQAKLNRNVMALATNSDSLGTTKTNRRSPTPAERAALMPLVKAAFKEKGVAVALLPSLTTVNLTALDLDKDGKSELVGSFVVKKQKGGAARYALFLFAEPRGASYHTTVLQYDQFTGKDIMSGADITIIENGVYLERLVDALDLDGDGVAEVVTVRDGLEGDGYSIMKKQDGKWNRIYEFANYRCGF